MSKETSRFVERDPTLWQIVERLVDRFVSMSGTVDRAYLEANGILYSTFSTYATGRSMMPGWVLARLLGYVSWDWAWGLATNERVLLAESILRDRDTKPSERLRAMALYFGVLRAGHDFAGHARLVKDLRKRFPLSRFPLEATAIDHDECLNREARHDDPAVAKESQAQTIRRWQRVRKSLLHAEQAGLVDIDLRAAVHRDFAASMASLVPKGQSPQGELREVLLEARSALIGCECLLPNRTARAFHFYCLVQVEVVLGDLARANAALKNLEHVCKSESGAHTDRSDLWLRYDLATAFILEFTKGSEFARAHVLRACQRLRHLGCATWEADLMRDLISSGPTWE